MTTHDRSTGGGQPGSPKPKIKHPLSKSTVLSVLSFLGRQGEGRKGGVGWSPELLKDVSGREAKWGYQGLVRRHVPLSGTGERGFRVVKGTAVRQPGTARQPDRS